MEAAIAKGRALPQWYLEEPCLMPGDDFYMKAFWDLSTCRSVGMSVGPIPWRDIVEYADRMQLEPDVSAAFVFVIREMDAAYLKNLDKETQQTTKTTAPKKGARLV